MSHASHLIKIPEIEVAPAEVDQGWNEKFGVGRFFCYLIERPFRLFVIPLFETNFTYSVKGMRAGI